VLRITPATPGSRILIEAGAGASARIEGRPVAPLRGGTWLLVGAPAQGFTFEIATRDRDRIAVRELATGLPPGSATLLAARPPRSVPFADGDATITTTWVVLAEKLPFD
jgi:hypothetical protein